MEKEQSTQFDPCQFGYYQKFNHLGKWRKPVKEKTVVSQNSFLECDYPGLLCNHWNEGKIYYNVWGKVYRTSILKSLSHQYEHIPHFLGEDLIINLQSLAVCQSAMYLPNCFYVYNDLSGGTTRFHIDTISDLNCIKCTQLKYLSVGYQNSWIKKDSYDKILHAIHSETSAYFLLWLKEAKNHCDTETLVKIIEESLGYESFVAAREYYSSSCHENWEAVNLMRNGDISACMNAITEDEPDKRSLRKLLGKIYRSI